MARAGRVFTVAAASPSELASLYSRPGIHLCGSDPRDDRAAAYRLPLVSGFLAVAALRFPRAEQGRAAWASMRSAAGAGRWRAIGLARRPRVISLGARLSLADPRAALSPKRSLGMSWDGLDDLAR